MGTKRIFEISSVATEDDLDLGYFLALDKNGRPTSKLPSDYVAKRSVQNKIIESIAPLFDKDKVGGYNANDCVMYLDGGLYIFNFAHPQGQQWTGLDVSPIDVKTLTSDPAFIQTAVNQWLQEHPEATTTVQDASLTLAKFSDALKKRVENPFVTPEEFGAYGDGVHDDSDAIQAAINFARNINRGSYVVLKASNGYKYRIKKNILLYNGVTLQGSTRWGSWIDLHEGAQVCLANNWAGSSTEESRLKYVTIDGNDTSDYCVRSGDNDDNYVVTQCVLEDVYMKNGRVAACYFRGTISQFNHCYFYYSPTGLVARRCNAVTLRDCNFWDVGTTLDLDRCTNINFIADWFEGGNESDRGRNNLQIKVSNNSNVFFENCQFQGTTTNTQYILKQLDTDPRNNYSLYFNQCRFNYPNAENPLFEFQGWDNIHLQIENSYFYNPLLSAIIDNSHTLNKQALKYAIHNNTAYDTESKEVPLFTDPENCLAVTIFTDNNKNLPNVPNGLVLGGSLFDTENNAKTNEGLFYLNKSKKKIRFALDSNWINFAFETYVTPEEFGAYGDGVHDDSDAIQAAIDAATGNAVVFLTKINYRVEKNIRIGSGCTICGEIRQTKIDLKNGAVILIGKNVAGTEIRLKNLTIKGNNTSSYCVCNEDSSKTAYQIYFDNVYMDGATVTACVIYGNRVQFNKCYFYDSACGLSLNGNDNYVENSLFSGDNVAISINGKNNTIAECLFETSTKMIDVSNDSLVLFQNCNFIGKSGECYMVNDSTDKNIDITFVNCSIKYTNNTNTSNIFTVRCTSSQNIFLRFYNCDIQAFYCTNFINNSNCSDYHFKLAWQNISNFGTSTQITSNVGYKRIDMNLSLNEIGLPKLFSGLILGSNKSVADSYLNDYNGFIFYDTSSDRLKMVSDGSQRLIPTETVGTLANLESTATLDNVISKFNDLLIMLRESHVLKS